MRNILIILNLSILLTNGILWKSIKKNVPNIFLESEANCNLHNYSIVLNSPALCNTDDVSLLVLVRSIPAHSDRRQIIRKTWGSLKDVKGRIVKLAFLFGNNTPTYNEIIQTEHNFYQDIIQESFSDTYQTLHLKTVMAWKWAVTYCPNASFVIVSNDEMFIDIFKTVEYLNQIIETKQHEYFYGCWMEREANIPNRNLKHKHGVAWKHYPGKRYPAFCNGNGYIMSKKITRKLYEMSLNTPAFMPDDVWTGVLSAKLGLVIWNIHERIVLKTTYKFIQRYHSENQYVKIDAILLPLDRLYTKCEVCVADFLWPNIMRYNKPSIIIKVSSKSDFYSKYSPVSLLSLILNGIFFIQHCLLNRRNNLSFVLVIIILTLIILSEIHLN